MRALESDTEARNANADGLVTLLLLRHSALLKVTADHPHRDIIQQARDSAQREIVWRIYQVVHAHVTKQGVPDYDRTCADAMHLRVSGIDHLVRVTSETHPKP